MPQTARQTPQASPEPMPNHRDIMARLAEHERRAGMTDLVMQRIEKKLDDALKAIGGESEDEYGKPIGTGVVGRLMRLELRFDVYRKVLDRGGWLVVGGAAVLAISGPLVWWLVEGRLTPILR